METDLKQILAANVRRRRAGLGISQDELADRAGLHRTYVGAVERGERNISLNSLAKLGTALDVTPALLLRDEGAENG